MRGSETPGYATLYYLIFLSVVFLIQLWDRMWFFVSKRKWTTGAEYSSDRVPSSRHYPMITIIPFEGKDWLPICISFHCTREEWEEQIGDVLSERQFVAPSGTLAQ